MTTKPSPFKRAVTAAKQAMAGQQYGTHGQPFLCPFCGNDRFTSGFNAAILSMHTLVCDECGHAEFFTKTPEPIEA